MNKTTSDKGKEQINMLTPNGYDSIQKGLKTIAPDMANYVIEFIFGSLYSREGFDMKTKQIITLTSLAVLGNAPSQLTYHINGALNIGITRPQIIDIFTHISGYAGFPAALNAIANAREVFKDRDTKSIEN